MRGIDPEALQSFREGNLLYRMGSALGSKGEICNLPKAAISLSTGSSNEDLSREVVCPPRGDTESPF